MPDRNQPDGRSLGYWIALIGLLAALLAAGLWAYLGMTVSLDEPSRHTSSVTGSAAPSAAGCQVPRA